MSEPQRQPSRPRPGPVERVGHRDLSVVATAPQLSQPPPTAHAPTIKLFTSTRSSLAIKDDGVYCACPKCERRMSMGTAGNARVGRRWMRDCLGLRSSCLHVASAKGTLAPQQFPLSMRPRRIAAHQTKKPAAFSLAVFRIDLTQLFQREATGWGLS